MNPYSILSNLYAVNSLRATLTRSDGRVYLLEVEPEERKSEAFSSEYAGAVDVRAWSTAADSLRDENGAIYFPGEGDVLRINDLDGTPLAYKLARDAISSRFWRWKWDRPGGRIVFYTRKDGSL